MRRIALVVVVMPALACAASSCAPEVEPPPPSTMDARVVVDERGLVPALVCPGAVGCESSSGPLRAGFGARAVTPVLERWTDEDADGLRGPDEPYEDVDGDGVFDPIWLAGFSPGRLATDVHDDVWARAVVFEQGDVRIGMVSLDAVGVFHEDVVRVRLAAQEAGLELDHVVVASTHTHEAKDTMGLWGESFGTTGYDAEYMAFVAAQATGALRDAVDGLRPASVRAARTEAPGLIRDTRLPELVDEALTALEVTDHAGAVFGVLAFWGNHPEALGSRNTLLTSDYPHYLREELEARRPGATAVFFSGSLGGLMTMIGANVCPGATGEDECPQGSYRRAEEIGRRVADAALDALDEQGEDLLAPALSFRRLPLLVPPTNPRLAIAFQLGMVPRDVYTREGVLVDADQLALVPVEEVTGGDLAIHTEVNLVSLGDVVIATVPGELYPELWLVKEDGGLFIERPEGGDYPDASPERPIQSTIPEVPFPVVVNNGNDALGYIIPKTQYDALEPRAYDEDGQYGEENSLGGECAPSVTEGFRALMELAP